MSYNLQIVCILGLLETIFHQLGLQTNGDSDIMQTFCGEPGACAYGFVMFLHTDNPLNACLG